MRLCLLKLGIVKQGRAYCQSTRGKEKGVQLNNSIRMFNLKYKKAKIMHLVTVELFEYLQMTLPE